MKPKITIQLPEELLEELKDCVVYLQSKGQPITLAGLLKSGAEAELARLKDQYTKGKAFPKRTGVLRVGRRIG